MVFVMVLFLLQHNHFQIGSPLEIHVSTELSDSMKSDDQEPI